MGVYLQRSRHGTIYYFRRKVPLAPGAQIRDTSNRIIMPVAVPAGALVKFRLNNNGQVRDVWILSREEATK